MRSTASPDPTTSPPVFWTEVFSRPDARWLPVDPIRGIINRRKVFDPSPAAQATTGDSTRKVKTKQENRMVYVMAFEEDGYARDVTRRYAREYGSKVAKVQGGSASGGGSKARHVWWRRVVDIVKRPYRLVRIHLTLLSGSNLDLGAYSTEMTWRTKSWKPHRCWRACPLPYLGSKIIHCTSPFGQLHKLPAD